MKFAISRPVYILILLSLGLSGCGWSTRYVSSSPNGKGEIAVEEKQFFTDSRIRVALNSGHRKAIICAENRDWLVGLVEFYWSRDSDVVGIAICNRGSEALVLAA